MVIPVFALSSFVCVSRTRNVWSFHRLKIIFCQIYLVFLRSRLILFDNNIVRFVYSSTLSCIIYDRVSPFPKLATRLLCEALIYASLPSGSLGLEINNRLYHRGQFHAPFRFILSRHYVRLIKLKSPPPATCFDTTQFWDS